MDEDIEYEGSDSPVSSWLLVDSCSLTRSKELWYADGTIIIRTQSTIFRVYRGILEVRSAVLAGLFQSSSASPDDQEIMEDCPIVKLDDSPADMTNFLKAILDSGFYEKSTNASFPVIAGILRLSTKYDVHYLRQRAVSHLSKMYPSTLDQWDRQPGSRSLDYDFLALNLARETVVHSILPGIMYRCCAFYSIAELFDGAVPAFLEESAADPVVEITEEDRRACLIAREDLRTEKREKVFAFLSSPEHPNCASREDCNARRLEWLHRLGSNCCVFEESFDWRSFGAAVCSSCYSEAKTSYDHARRQLWDHLPGMFGLLPWEELRKSAGKKNLS